MAPGYEWVFVTCYAGMAVSTLLALQASYLSYQERRAEKANRRRSPSRRPRPPRQVF
jgi:hypothetical protein